MGMTDIPMPDHPHFARRTRLALNALVPVIGILALNAAAMVVGWGVNLPTYDRLAIAPPGWLNGLVWIAIFAAWGVARWEARRASPEASNRSRWVNALIGAGVTYVFLAGAFGPGWSQAHHAVVLALAAMALVRVSPVAPKATLWLALPAAWVGYATVVSFAALTSR